MLNKSLNKFRPYKLTYKRIGDVLPGDLLRINPQSPEEWFEIEKLEPQGGLVNLFFKNGKCNCEILIWACNIYPVKTSY